MPSPTSTAALAEITASGVRAKHKQIIWDALSPTIPMCDFDVMQATGLSRATVTGRLNDLRNGALEGCTLNITLARNRNGRKVHQYTRAYDFIPLFGSALDAKFKAAGWVQDGQEWQKPDATAAPHPRGWIIRIRKDVVFIGRLTAGNFRSVMEAIMGGEVNG